MEVVHGAKRKDGMGGIQGDMWQPEVLRGLLEAGQVLFLDTDGHIPTSVLGFLHFYGYVRYFLNEKKNRQRIFDKGAHTLSGRGGQSSTNTEETGQPYTEE